VRLIPPRRPESLALPREYRRPKLPIITQIACGRENLPSAYESDVASPCTICTDGTSANRSVNMAASSSSISIDVSRGIDWLSTSAVAP
jgi:hypothetical protein